MQDTIWFLGFPLRVLISGSEIAQQKLSVYLLPALGIGCIEVPVFAAGNRRAAPAPGKKFAFGAFLKLRVVAVLFHLADPHIRKPVLKDISHFAVLYPAAGVNIAGRQDRQVAVTAVAAAVRSCLPPPFRGF